MTTLRDDRYCLVIGTRPETIKLAPVWRELQRHDIKPQVLVIDQHQELLTRHLDECGITPALRIGFQDGTLAERSAGILAAAVHGLAQLRPKHVIVQGDTTTACMAAQAAFLLDDIPVAHVEAGLRTYDATAPYPEELNRQIIARIARWHFAPTALAACRLDVEHTRGVIYTVGNTGIDELYHVLKTTSAPVWIEAVPHPFVLVTYHRRENRSELYALLTQALNQFIVQRSDAYIHWIGHHSMSHERARNAHTSLQIAHVAPGSHRSMAHAIANADLVITDSGGVIEEAATLGTPTLVFRHETERDEALMDNIKLLPPRALAADVVALMRELIGVQNRQRSNVFGDGTAARKITAVLPYTNGAQGATETCA